MFAEILELKDRIQGYQEQNRSLQAALKWSENSKEKQKNSYEERLAEKDAIIRELKNKVAHLTAVVGHNGTTTGIPTSATPVNKKKLIPNSRRSSGKKKGGQPGYEQHTMADIEEPVSQKQSGIRWTPEPGNVPAAEGN